MKLTHTIKYKEIPRYESAKYQPIKKYGFQKKMVVIPKMIKIHVPRSFMIKVDPHGIQNRYKAMCERSLKKGEESDLSLEDYQRLVDSNCFYCDESILTKGISLDRKNNDGAYTKDNVVPCCHLCNQVKKDVFTFDEMVNFISPAIKLLMKSRSLGI